jgi:CheY-like chemotaxis protein
LTGQIEITVTDTGAGMRPDFLPHVFERFRQSDASTTRDHGGLGLGLAIVKKLVELHGGRVEARSDGLGKGSTFVVLLPQAMAAPLEREPVDSPADRQPPAEGRADGEPGRLTGVKVLVVDDEPDGRTLVGRILQECSAQVALAGSAREALGTIGEFEPDVLISDIGMPDTDGYELMRQVRALGGPAGSVPAAALTALARPEDRTRAILSGYQTHISKPVDAVELIAVVAALAGRAEGV